MIGSVWTHSALEDGLGTPSQGGVRLFGSVTIFVLVIVIVGFVFMRIDHHLQRSNTVESDNRTWVIAQIEVDLRHLQVAALQAQLPGDKAAQLAEVRLAYDILYSRVDLAQKASLLAEVPLRDSEGWNKLWGEDGLIRRFEPYIDGGDQTLLVALPLMSKRIADAAPAIRAAIVDTFNLTLEQGDDARQELRNSLYGLMISLGVIVVALAMMLLTIYLQNRVQARHRKMLELALHNLRTTVESSLDAVLILDSTDRIIGANDAGIVMLGRPVNPSEPLVLTDVLQWTPDEQGHATNDRCETSVVRADGTIMPVEMNLAPAHTATGLTFTIAFLRDMSNQLEREQKLADALEAARHGEETKDRFLAIMSHEMRTPLSGLMSAIDLLESSGAFQDHQAWLLEIIRSCAQTTLEQVNNVLELTRLAARAINDYPESDFDIREMAAGQIQQYQAFAMRRSNLLTLDTCGVGPSVVHAPVNLVRRMLHNLLSNAIKFTRDGSIHVTLSTDPSPRPDHCLVTLSVRDTGIGIEEADLERIFHNFETLDSSYSRMQEGSGLGLGITKLAAEALGGKISVQSRRGEGSIFTIEFEAQLARQAPEQIAAPVEEPHLSAVLDILLAEDNDINRHLLERQLIRLGHRVTTAADGIEAVEAAEKGRFDIVLMDVSMPRMDGLTATRLMHERKLLGAARVIALTAQAAPNRIQEYRDAGMEEVVTKPVHMAVLNEIMQRMVLDAATPFAPQIAPEQPDLLDRGLLAELNEDMDPAFLQVMLDRFRKEMAQAQDAMVQAVGSSAEKDLAAIAHKAAGAAAVMGCATLAEALRSLETAAPEETGGQLVARLEKIRHLINQSDTALSGALRAA